MVILEFWVFNHSHWQIKKTKQKKHVLTVRTSNCPWIGDLNLLTEWLISIKNDLKHLLISQSIWKIQSFNHNLENRKSKCSRVDLSEKNEFLNFETDCLNVMQLDEANGTQQKFLKSVKKRSCGVSLKLLMWFPIG